MPITTDLDRVRLEIGDTDVTAALFSDEEIGVYIANRTIITTSGTKVHLLLASADLCDSLATRFARQFDFAEDGQSFSRGQRSAFYAERARELRRRAGGGATAVASSVATAVGDNLPSFGSTSF